MAIERVLKNPTYAGLLKVETYKDYAGGLFDCIHEPITDKTTGMMVQEKMKRPEKTRAVIDDEIPFRGVLKCHCGNPLSGVPSRSKSGKPAECKGKEEGLHKEYPLSGEGGIGLVPQSPDTALNLLRIEPWGSHPLDIFNK